MDNGFYSFRYHQFKFNLPLTNIVVDIQTPWSQIISIGSCFVYMILILWIFPLIRPRNYGALGKLHHSILFFYSLGSFSSVFYHVVSTGEITDRSRFYCQPIPGWLRLVSLSFILSKVWEWGDTAILRWKEQSLSKIGFLHIYHHATTFLLFLLVTNFPGAEKCGMLLNGFVHTLMYFHFAYRLPKILRPLITGLQIAQLMTVTYVWHEIPNLCVAYENFPRDYFWEYLTPYALVPVYCLFFFKFFIEQYLLPQSSKKKKN